jgi:allantoate deiminase
VQQLSTNKDRAEQTIARCRRLALFSEDAGGTRRTFLSPPIRDCHREIAEWMKPLGVHTRIDAAGNLRGLYPGAAANAPRLLIGSHLDTVPNAGAYDGVLGVVLAVALLESLNGKKLPFAVEVIGFSEEEGVRFGAPFIGSRALVGRLPESFLDLADVDGISMRHAIQDFGLHPAEIPQARIGHDALGYLEFHIEQGPVLETLNLPLGVVEAIVGQTRLALTFLGRANHAGTTPMHLRYDAVAAAAAWITIVENAAKETEEAVATVGKIAAQPGASNVIAGEVTLSLDVRHRSDQIRFGLVNDLMHAAEKVARQRGLTIKQNVLLNQPAVPMDSFLADAIDHAIRKAGCTPHRMVSGAGHDAMILAEKIPAAMIFLRTPGGISHDPAESVLAEDVEKAMACGVHLLHQLAESKPFLTRTCRA